MSENQLEAKQILNDEHAKRVQMLLILISLLTVLDGLASWFSIDYMGIAKEGNDNLNAIASIVGFEGAMIVRVFWGIGLSAVLALLALKVKKERQRKFIYRGMWFIAIALLLLFAYHIVVISIGFMLLL